MNWEDEELGYFEEEEQLNDFVEEEEQELEPSPSFFVFFRYHELYVKKLLIA